MADIKEESDSAVVNPPRVGIGVGTGLSGLLALKWALERIVPPDSSVHLLHVQSPLRYIPYAMGGKFPVEKANRETVKRFKEDIRLEKENLLNNYRQLCDKRKVKHTVCYSENDSVQKGLVDQIMKLGITNLVLGTSSQSLLSRAFKKESIPTSVAKHAPGFCTVMVICKGKLCFVKDATESPSSSCSPSSSLSAASEISIPTASETSTSSGTVNEDELMTNERPQDAEGSIWSDVRDSMCISPHNMHLHSASMDISPRPSGSDYLSRTTEFGVPVMMRNYSSPSESWYLQSAPTTPYSRQPWSTIDYSITHPINLYGTGEALASESSNVQDRLPADNSNFQMHDYANQRIPSEDAINPFATVVPSNNTAESAPYSDHDALSQSSLDLGHLDNVDDLPAQRMHVSAPEESVMAVADSDGVVASDSSYLLQKQLHEAKQSADWAQREAEMQACNLKKAEEVVASARKMIVEHERRRDEALKEANLAKQQAIRDANRREEAQAALQVALRERGTLQQMLAEEVRNHQETRAQLETQRRVADAYVVEAETARKRYEEALVNLADVTRKLEVESELRKAAEAKASEESVAKLKAVATLQNEQQKYTEYTFQELQNGTNNFHEDNKLGEGGYGPVFRGKLHHTTVAIKVLAHDGSQGREEFQSEVEVLSRIRHPHMVMLLGACPEKGCIVYEYMANGSLEDRLNCKNGTPPLPWYVRFRICLEVAIALLFLHSRPQPIVHRDLKPGNILLDHHFVSKIGDVGLAKLVPNNLTFSVTMYKESVLVGTFAYMDPDYQRTGVVSCESDVYALGIVMLQLLTGRPAVGVANLVEEAVDRGKFEGVLDKSAGEWPLAEALAIACLSLQCAEPRRKHRPNLEKDVLPQLERIQNVAGLAAANMASAGPSSSGMTPIIPSFFFCPILQEIMESPHIAADGFTYEHDAIKLWLQEHDTSPMTNLRLNHKNLTPNHTLRSAIREWYENGLI
ncbi:hypothetical protein GOP47_0015758 [Adiantum capillus-veneris]|uniref:RING-type E3 ubiquitin transferase n=1 Tax=Adiantum capillus-veneris TaxID=13818 RepID=A0A9D4ZCX1_ADICA|nr:hypothetical protein GOP47_0015758 [Adiantum capillus-veneris]